MSNLRLTNRPPEVPANTQYGWKVKSHVHKETKISGTIEEQIAIHKTIGRVIGTLDAMVAIPVSGKFTIVVTSETTTWEGELTAYHGPFGETRDSLVKEIDRTLFSLRREYTACITRVVFTLDQSCEFVLEDPPASPETN